MIQPDTLSYVASDPAATVVDLVEAAVRENGGQQLVWPSDFAGEPAAGWRGQLDVASDQLLIHFPDGTIFYEGTMPTVARWQKDAREAAEKGIVMITGPIAGLADVDRVIRAGRATWIRIRLSIS
ncbi:hypothetical protein [Nocardia sp. JCM 34519]|nr:hypothetical protein [Nocardia sp. JCM 34519]